MVFPARGISDRLHKLVKGDLYVGRAREKRGLVVSQFCNSFKAVVRGRVDAIARFADVLASDEKPPQLHLDSFWTKIALPLLGGMPCRRLDQRLPKAALQGHAIVLSTQLHRRLRLC